MPGYAADTKRLLSDLPWKEKGGKAGARTRNALTRYFTGGRGYRVLGLDYFEPPTVEDALDVFRKLAERAKEVYILGYTADCHLAAIEVFKSGGFEMPAVMIAKQRSGKNARRRPYGAL